MHLSIIFFIALILSSCSVGYEQPYPAGWPPQLKMANDCSKTSGIYSEGEPFSNGAAPPGAWAFLFPFDALRLKDNTVKTREIHIYFDVNKSLHAEYLVDKMPVSKKMFSESQYVCDVDGLHVSLGERYGNIDNKLPDIGVMKVTAVMFRSLDYLYVKTSWNSKQLVFYFFPVMGNSEQWNRFLFLHS